jgi:hypothetical protein
VISIFGTIIVNYSLHIDFHRLSAHVQNMNKLRPFSEVELAQIRLDCARGLAEIDADLGVSIQSDEDLARFLRGIEADADKIIAARQRDSGR